MSSEDRGASYSTADTPVYTVHAGEQQGHTNYGFHVCQPQEPPPKYEDVVSGEYLNWNPSNSFGTSRSESRPAQLQSEPPRHEGEKEKCHKIVGTFLVALLLIIIFMWRVSIT